MDKDTAFYKKNILNLRGNLISLEKPLVMGILNLTPDSFFSGSMVNDKSLITVAEKMLSEGADILDLGAYSSRPGAIDITEEEEKARLLPAIKEIVKRFPEAIVSVDTFRSQVALEAVEAGGSIINDISGGSLDEKMPEVVASLGVPYILMHMKGTPQNMKELSYYDDLLLDLIDYFRKKIYNLNLLGVKDIILDPGFGFAKNIDQNFYLLKNLKDLRILKLPLLVGLSRKSMIYKTLKTEPEEALTGTIALNMVALQNGANILRVHDVKEAVETVKLFTKLNF